MKTTLWIAKTALIVLALTPAFASAGIEHSNPSSLNAKTARPEGIWDIQKYVDTLSAYFRWPVNTVKRDFAQAIPIALENVVKRKDETKITEALGQLFATVNTDQIKVIEKAATAKLAAKMEEEKTDSEAIALLERIVWAAEGLLGHPPERDEKNIAFMDAFFGEKGAYAKTLAEKQIILDKIKVANDSNTSVATRKAAKEWLRTNLSRDAIMAFVDGQLASGRKDLAMDLVDAVAWIDPLSKEERFLEFFNGASVERLHLGPTRETMEAALSSYAKGKGGLHTATLAEKEHEAVVPREYVSKDSTLVEGRPASVAPPKAFQAFLKAATSVGLRQQPLVGAAAAGLGSRVASLAAGRVGTGSPPPNPVRVKPNVAQDKGASIFAANCTATCHSSWPKDKGAMKASVISGSMPKNKTLSQSEKDALVAYLSK